MRSCVCFLAYLSILVGILDRCHGRLLALQDIEVTIITQTIVNLMFFG